MVPKIEGAATFSPKQQISPIAAMTCSKTFFQKEESVSSNKNNSDFVKIANFKPFSSVVNRPRIKITKIDSS